MKIVVTTLMFILAMFALVGFIAALPRALRGAIDLVRDWRALEMKELMNHKHPAKR